MSQPPPCPPPDLFAGLVRRIAYALEGLRMVGIITSAMLRLVSNRFGGAFWALRRLAARIEAGSYRPRRSTPHRRSQSPKPREAPAIPQKRGWVAAILPDANQYRGHLLALLAAPETERLIQVAPAEVARILRPLCWALDLKPPANLPAPPRRQPPPPAPQAAEAASPLPLREGVRGRGQNREIAGCAPLSHPPPAQGAGRRRRRGSATNQSVTKTT